MVRDFILASYDEERHPQEMADLAGCNLRTLKASENGFSMTSRTLLKHDQICFEKSVVQSIMQTTVRARMDEQSKGDSLPKKMRCLRRGVGLNTIAHIPHNIIILLHFLLGHSRVKTLYQTSYIN